MVKAKRLLEPLVFRSRRLVRDQVRLSDQAQLARLPQELRLPPVKRRARYQLLPDRVPLVELAAEHSSGSQFSFSALTAPHSKRQPSRAQLLVARSLLSPLGARCPEPVW